MMRYRLLGKSGLRVSELCLGWTYPRMAGAGLRVYPALSYSIGDL